MSMLHEMASGPNMGSTGFMQQHQTDMAQLIPPPKMWSLPNPPVLEPRNSNSIYDDFARFEAGSQNGRNAGLLRERSFRFVPQERTPKILPFPKSNINKIADNYPVHTLRQVAALLPQSQVEMLNEKIYPTLETKVNYATPEGEARTEFHVHEYQIGSHYITWDRAEGLVHLTELWRAALQDGYFPRDGTCKANIKPNAKADIVKLTESTPAPLAKKIKRVRGGFLRIQGTYVPFGFCKRVARRFCYFIRYELVPIFGPDFPGLCLLPTDDDFGDLRYDGGLDSPLPENHPPLHPNMGGNLPVLQSLLPSNYELGPAPPMPPVRALHEQPRLVPYTPIHQLERSRSQQSLLSGEFTDCSNMGSDRDYHFSTCPTSIASPVLQPSCPVSARMSFSAVDRFAIDPELCAGRPKSHPRANSQSLNHPLPTPLIPNQLPPLPVMHPSSYRPMEVEDNMIQATMCLLQLRQGIPRCDR